MTDEATSGANPATGPTPNTVCASAEFFSAALDMLAYNETTKFRNGTCLLLEPATMGLFAVGICRHRHVHLHVGPLVSLGDMVPVAISAYAFALVYDREAWGAGLIPDVERAKQALRDCLAVIRLHAPSEFVDDITRMTAKLMNTWVKGAIAGGSAQQEVERCEAEA